MSGYPPSSLQFIEFSPGRVKSELIVPYANGKGVLTAIGSCTIDGDTCTIWIESVSYNEEFRRLCSLRVVPQVDEAAVKVAMNRDPEGKIIWQDEDTVQLQSPSNTLTLTRVAAD